MKKYKQNFFIFVLSVLIIIASIATASTIAFAAVENANVMKSYTSDSTDDYHAFRKKVVTITFLDAIDESSINSDDTLYKWDVSAAENGSVVAWMKLNETETDYAGENRYDVYIAADGGVTANDDSSYLFYNFAMLKEINGLEHLHTDNVINMNSMFSTCRSLKSLDVSDLNTSEVTNMDNMFACCSSLTSLDLSNWNTKNLTDVGNMFYYCSDLYNVNLSNWDTSNLIDMSYMFYEIFSIQTINFSGWDMSKVVSTSGMFNETSYFKLTNMILNDVSFNNETIKLLKQNIKNLIIKNADFSDVSSFAYMFSSTIETIEGLDTWSTGHITDMSGTFQNCRVKKLDLSNWDTSNVTSMYKMFQGCSVNSLDLSSFNTSCVTNMQQMFSNCQNLKSLDLSSFDTSKVTNMSWMFSGCSNLKTIYIGYDWSVAQVVSGDCMFFDCTQIEGANSFIYNSDCTDKSYATTKYYMTHINGSTDEYPIKTPVDPPTTENPDNTPFVPEEPNQEESLSFFQKIIQWFNNLFAKLFSF